MQYTLIRWRWSYNPGSHVCCVCATWVRCTNLAHQPGSSARNLCSGNGLRKMPAAQRYVPLVAADLDLLALAFDRTVCLDTHHHDGFAPAVTDGLDFDQVVGPAQQLRAAGKKIAAEVGAQSITKHRDVQFVDHAAELFDLLGREELRLV